MTSEITALVAQGITDDQLAVWFHNTYERLAPEFGYETRPDTKAFDPQSKNGKLMVAVCGQAAAALRALAGEVKELQRDGFLGNPPKYVMWHEFEYFRNEANTLRSEVTALKKAMSPESVHGLPNWQALYNAAALERHELRSSIASEQRYAREVSDHMHKVSDERDTLRAEAAALRKDAERYRWLRDDTMADDLYEILEIIGGAEGNTLDARIDAALADKPQQSVTDSIDSPQPPLE